MSTTNTGAAKAAIDDALLASQQQKSLGETISDYFKRLRGGDLGALPIIIGLAIIAAIFQGQNENFLSNRNFVNLVLQMAGITVMAIGVVYVLLLGEIDLSIGYVSGVAGVLMTWLLKGGLAPFSVIGNLLSFVGVNTESMGWLTTTLDPQPWYVAIPIALVVAALIGLLHGFIITRFQLPSFIVTLAGLLAWNGVVLLLVGEGGTIVLQDPVALGIANSYFGDGTAKGVVASSTWAWVAVGLMVILFATSQFMQISNRRRQNLPHTPMLFVILQTILVAAVTVGVTYVCLQDRGLPIIGLIIVILLALFTYIATSTRFGRYVYAVGGNKEAARRAGIRVERIRIYVFMISSLMAGAGGLVLASRLRSVATDAGGGNLVLNSIAAAVIGGTSLFGGSGKVTSALLGALVVASVENGMGLLGLSSGVKFIITGLVLLVAVLVDSISRSSQSRSGLK